MLTRFANTSVYMAIYLVHWCYIQTVRSLKSQNLYTSRQVSGHMSHSSNDIQWMHFRQVADCLASLYTGFNIHPCSKYIVTNTNLYVSILTIFPCQATLPSWCLFFFLFIMSQTISLPTLCQPHFCTIPTQTTLVQYTVHTHVLKVSAGKINAQPDFP